MNMTIGGVITGFMIYGIQHGLPNQLYFDVAEKGWAYTILSVPLVFIVIDAGAYYVHRALHIKWLFKRVHRHHHKYIATTSFAAVAMHPVELMSLQAAAFALIFIVPLHPAVMGFVMIYILVFNIIDHSGVDLESVIPWQPPSAYHDDHHVHFHVNFGQHLMFWDRIHGTLRLPGREYGASIFGGRGVAMPKGRAVKDDFEGY
jgi:lathosterol oxidase